MSVRIKQCRYSPRLDELKILSSAIWVHLMVSSPGILLAMSKEKPYPACCLQMRSKLIELPPFRRFRPSPLHLHVSLAWLLRNSVLTSASIGSSTRRQPPSRPWFYKVFDKLICRSLVCPGDFGCFPPVVYPGSIVWMKRGLMWGLTTDISDRQM